MRRGWCVAGISLWSLLLLGDRFIVAGGGEAVAAEFSLEEDGGELLHRVDDETTVSRQLIWPRHHRKRAQKQPPTGSSSSSTAATTARATPNSLCVIGCTPYVNYATTDATGYAKYQALVKEMVSGPCDVVVHIGDPKPAEMPCNATLLSKPLLFLRNQAKKNGRLALYAPGDNEVGDCHRHRSTNTPTEFTKAAQARQSLVSQLNLNSGKDLTGRYAITSHTTGLHGTQIPGSTLDNKPARFYSCDFDKYVNMDTFAIATLEVPGGNWFLEDERTDGYPQQDTADPLADRIWMYLNAKDCALEWLDQSAERANQNGKRALFVLFHGVFYNNGGSNVYDSNNIGSYYNPSNLEQYTQRYTGKKISKPYQPLFDKLTALGLQYPNLIIQVVHSDGHKLTENRLNPGANNQGLGPGKLFSNHNVMLRQVEGDARGLTMYARFTTHPTDFQPVTHQQKWSRAAYDIAPLGHSKLPY